MGPWGWNPDEEGGRGYLRVRLLTDEDLSESLPHMFGREGRIHRLALRRDDCMGRGISELCAGCAARSCILSGRTAENPGPG